MKKNELLRIAIVGVGWAGARHVEAVREPGRPIEVAALVDSDARHLEETAVRFGIGQTYASLEPTLMDEGIDAIDIATPHSLHLEMAVAAAKAGKHVLVEKPMALNVPDATAMISAADANGVKLFVAENVA